MGSVGLESGWLRVHGVLDLLRPAPSCLEVMTASVPPIMVHYRCVVSRWSGDAGSISVGPTHPKQTWEISVGGRVPPNNPWFLGFNENSMGRTRIGSVIGQKGFSSIELFSENFVWPRNFARIRSPKRNKGV